MITTFHLNRNSIKDTITIRIITIKTTQESRMFY